MRSIIAFSWSSIPAAQIPAFSRRRSGFTILRFSRC
jgi:hypothetical protein